MSKLLFNSCIGKLYDDKVIIKKNKFINKNIHDLDLIYFIDKRLNIIFFVISVIGMLMTILFIVANDIKLLLTGFFFIFFLMSMICKVKKYYFKIVLNDDKEVSIKIRKNEKEFAKQLTKEYWNYNKSQTE